MRVVVVGAGIVGASAAYHLGVRGVDVVVVDRGDGGQATAAGAGIVGPWLSSEADPEWYRIAAAGAAYFPRLVELLAGEGESELGYAAVGGLVVHEDPTRLGPVLQLLDERRAAAPPLIGRVSRVDPAQARLLFPPLSPDLHGIHVERVSRVDGRLLRDALLRSAARHGALRRTGSARLQPSGVSVDGQHEPADAIVVAAGAWSGDLCAPLGLRLPVTPQRGQIVHLRLPAGGDASAIRDSSAIRDTGDARGSSAIRDPSAIRDIRHARDTGDPRDTSGWPVVQALERHYLLAFPGSRVVAGATREDGTGFDYRVTAAGQAEVLRQALTVAPGLSDATVLETRVGFRPVSADGLPLLGAVAEIDHLVVATGLGPTGLTIGPYAGELAARLVLGEDPGMDLTAYRPTRAASAEPGRPT